MDRFASLYATDTVQRVGPSSPVSYNMRTQRYCGWIIHPNHGSIAWEKPSKYDCIITFEAGQYSSGYPAVIC